MTRLLGYTPDELTSMAPGALTHPDDAERERALIAELATGRRNAYGLEKRSRHKDGRWIWVGETVSVLEGEDPPRSAVAHLLDISERKRAETELERAHLNLERSNAELDQFAYVASHDLKEPLILLSAYARMLEERHGDDLDEEGRTFLDHVREEAGRMKAMIDDLLDYSRLETRAEAASRVELGEMLEYGPQDACAADRGDRGEDREGGAAGGRGEPGAVRAAAPQFARQRAQVPR